MVGRQHLGDVCVAWEYPIRIDLNKKLGRI